MSLFRRKTKVEQKSLYFSLAPEKPLLSPVFFFGAKLAKFWPFFNLMQAKII